VLSYLRDHGWTCGKHACASAAGGGHIDVLEWLRAQDPPCPWDAKEYTLAARNGHVHVLHWLRAQQPPVPWKANACAAAAKRGHLDALHWLRSQEPPCPWSGDEMSVAARAGHVHVMEYLQDQGCAVNENTCRSALLGLQLGALQWLRSRDPLCPWSELAVGPGMFCTALTAAGRGCDVDAAAELLAWLAANSPWYGLDSSGAYDGAAAE
jgi:hypothetical protein